MDTQTDIKTITDLERQLSQVSIPMEDVAPDVIREWLSAFANSNGTVMTSLNAMHHHLKCLYSLQ